MELRAEFVDVSVSNADQLNGALTRRIGVAPNIGSKQRGGLLEASYRFFSFECSQLCGAGHSFMRGVIIVSDASSR
jgi:hypothetical protein